MNYYDALGNSITLKEFIDLYSQNYFIGNDKVIGFPYTQSSEYVEEQVIMPILKGHIKSYADLAKVMAWKMGKVKHMESQKCHSMKYASDWKECEEENPLRYNKLIDLESYAKYIIDNRDILENMAVNAPQNCLCLLRDKSPKGIGTVYVITILFFLSHGKMPIYDRFAMGALLALERNVKPGIGAKIIVHSLPDKWDKNFENVYEVQYKEYIQKLDSLGIDYVNDRHLDRALWVYGHGYKIING